MSTESDAEVACGFLATKNIAKSQTTAVARRVKSPTVKASVATSQSAQSACTVGRWSV